MSFPRYANYRDSGIEWLGRVPAHWGTSKLKHAALFFSGGTPSKDRLDYWNGDVPWASSKDLKADALSDTQDHITERAVEDGAELVLPGDILVVVRGMILAHTFPVTKVLAPMAINQDLKAIRVRSDWSSDYFAALLRASAPETFRRLDEAGHGTKALRMEAWLGMELPRPPVREQEAIAAFLDNETAKIDALVAEQERLIELLKEKRQAVISHAVTKGVNPNAPMKDSGAPRVGSIPSHWRLLPLKHVARVGNGSTPNREVPAYWTESGFPWLNSGVVNSDEVVAADQFVTDLALKECHLPIVKSPAVLVGITGQGRTRGMAATLLFDATVSQHVAYLRPDTGLASARWLRRILDANYEALREDSEEGGSTKAAITCEQLGLLKVPLPPVAEQTAILEQLDAELVRLGRLSAEATRAIEILGERRAALISAAVTGQIDVRPESLRTAA